MKNQIILALILILSILPLVSAVKPVSEVNAFTEGFIIKHPEDFTLKANQDYEFEFHVYNISNGLAVTSGISCELHFYDDTGHHQYEGLDTTPSHTYDYSFDLNGTNFTEGDYYYNVYCNSSRLGGFSTIPLEVTLNGRERPGDIVIFFFSAIFLALMVLFLYTLITSIGHLFSLDLDVIDLAKNIGIYFGILGLYELSVFYLGNPNIDRFLLILLRIGGFTHLIIPLISFVLSITIGSLRKKKLDFGTKRIYRRPRGL